MRKAGGTTIVNYLRKVEKAYNLTLVSFEGGDIERPGTRNDTLYVSHIRDPVERAITNFKYSGRWSCQWLVYKHRRNPKTWTPTLENAKHINDWINQAKLCNRNQFNAKKRLWNCASNCFVRWLNHPIGHCDNPFSQYANSTQYQSALEKARGFHLIIQTVKLQDKEYIKSLERYFGVGSSDASASAFAVKTPMFCDRESKVANAANPLNVSEADRNVLSAINVADDRLFAALTSCPNGFQFPKGSLGNLQNQQYTT